MASDSHRENFLRLLQLLIEGGTTALRTYFDAIHPPATLAGVLAAKHSQLQNLYKKGIINSSQWPLLYPPSGNPDSKLFDITLLTMLLRNICGILTPTDPFWSTYPPDTDNSDKAHLVRIRMLRNEFGHRTTITINDSDFEAYWQKISDALVSLGAEKAEIGEMKTRPQGTKDYHGTLQRWIHCDLQELKMESEKVQNMGGKVNSKDADGGVAKKMDEVTEKMSELSSTTEKATGDIQQHMSELSAEVTCKSDSNTEKIVSEVKGDLKEIKEKIVSAIASLQVESPSRKIESKDAATITEEDKAASMRSSGSDDKDPPMKKVIQDFVKYLHQRYTTGEDISIEPLEDMGDGNFTLENMFTELEITKKDTEIKVPMYDIFTASEPSKTVRSVLLEGESGVGKTTFCQKLAYDWAKGALPKSFPQVEILLSLKSKEMSGGGLWKAISEQLVPEETNDDEREELFHYLKENQEKVLIILDGYDELPSHASVKESINKVVSKEALPFSYTLITSRPEKRLSKYFIGGNVLQVKGLHDVASYVSNFFNSVEEYVEFPLERISKGIFNLDLSNPLTLVLFCLCYKEYFQTSQEKGFLEGMTLRELYEKIVNSRIRRNSEKLNRDLDEEEIQELILKIGKIAFDALKGNTVTFSISKTSQHLINEGFFVRQKSLSVFRPVETFAFSHQSFQEYFCAAYLASRLGQGVVEPEVIGDLRLFDCVDCYSLAAMVGSNAVNVVESLARKVSEFPPQGIPICDDDIGSNALQLLCQCLVECKKVASEFVNLLKNVYQFLPCRVSVYSDRSSTLLGLSYLLSQDLTYFESLQAISCVSGSRPLSDLTIITVLLKSKDIGMATVIPGQLTEVLAASSSVQKLYIVFEAFPFHDGNFEKAMANVLSRNTSLRYLRLWCIFDEPEYEMGTSLFKSLKNNSTLSAIHIHFNSLGDACASELAKVLVVNTSLNVVYIGGEYLGDAGVASIAEALMVNTTVRALGIRGDNMTPEAGRALGEMFRHNTTITCLSLFHGKIGYSGALCIASGFSQNTTLEKIQIENAGIGATGVSALAKVIQNATHLDLSRNIIGTKGAKAIAKVIENSCKLKYLRIDRCNIDVLGVRDIAKALSKNTNLEELSVACAGIDDEGMCELARSVAKNKSLQVLIITYNNISEVGKRAIIEACAESQSLNHLFHENDPILNTCLKPHSVCLRSREFFYRFLFSSSLQGFTLKFPEYKQYEQG
ncbi:LOW QUALITY PROTEIN: protein NLRC3 [Nematostella vectensis]|uniref:LOW QUALITY PROTEIN: protein NLRC3 n=1 Tax=Nematostella vectensis TaxID=45351 RepID=UPI0020770D8E|nr:LOW QUALITY PROTEIN: protein NLRC3 [Nematostella vectensis]